MKGQSSLCVLTRLTTFSMPEYVYTSFQAVTLQKGRFSPMMRASWGGIQRFFWGVTSAVCRNIQLKEEGDVGHEKTLIKVSVIGVCREKAVRGEKSSSGVSSAFKKEPIIETVAQFGAVSQSALS